MQPVNLTIEAFMSDSVNNIVTIVEGLPGTTKNYTWLARSQINDTNPLMTAMYTLRIFDGQVGRQGYISNAGGYLSTYTGLKFGLYQPKYTPGKCGEWTRFLSIMHCFVASALRWFLTISCLNFVNQVLFVPPVSLQARAMR